MTEHTVFNIILSDLDMDPDILSKRDDAGAAIAWLARDAGEDIWFHTYPENEFGGYPTLLIECSDDFWKKIDDLDQVIAAVEYDGPNETVRNAAVKDHFEYKAFGDSGSGPSSNSGHTSSSDPGGLNPQL